MEGHFGFIHEKLDIKILILFILHRLPEPVDFEALTELTMCDGGISYFDFAECVADLIKTDHIQVRNDKYSITERGSKNSITTEVSLPASVKQKAEYSVTEYRAEHIRSAMINTSHEADENGGFTVDLALSDGIGEIVSMKLYAANERQAADLERGFRMRAESIYSALIEAILED